MADERRPSVEKVETDIKEAPKQDDAADLFEDGQVIDYSAKEANVVRWKLDLILLPMMAVTYILSFMDKVALTEASIFGIQESDHLVGQQYSWASSIFYFGYLIAQYPSAVLMQKIPIGRYFGTVVALWGVATTCMAATDSFATLAVCRFFLGAFETCVSPILTILVAQYYTTREQPLRASIWWACGGVGGFIADSITYSVSDSSWKTSRYETWQIVFLIFGPITIAWGVILFFLLPTSPMQAWFFTERERKISVLRVISNHTGVENREYKLHHIKEALLDAQVWMLCANAFLQCIPGGGITSFGKLIIKGLGYSSRKSVLMSFPPHAIQLCSNIIAGVISQTVPNTRCALMIIANCICLIGSVLISVLPSSQGLGPLYIIYVNTIPYILCMSLLSSNIGGFTKKATSGAMVFMSYAVGQIVAPQFFLEKEKPTYPTGFRAFYVSIALMIVVEIIMIVYLRRQNSLKRGAQHAIPQHSSDLTVDLQDLTDKEHPEFLYVY